MSFRLHASSGAFVAVTTLLLACGGTVVFEEGADGDGGNGSGGAGASGDGGNVIASTAATSSPASGNVGPGGPANGSGGTDDAVSIGPGPGGPGPSGGGFDPTGAGGDGTVQGPSGVGGADVGAVNGASATSGGGCSQQLDHTNQYCYAGSFCEDFRLEIECEIAFGAQVTCWCYQDGQQIAECSQPSNDFCGTSPSCCENFWVLPG